MKDLKKIKYFLFDLDNTLYSGDTKVFDQVDKKMSKFISEKLNVSIEEAKKIQKNYFHEYNTTLNGMIKSQGNLLIGKKTIGKMLVTDMCLTELCVKDPS